VALGVFPTLLPAECLQGFPGLDFAVVGEPERAVVMLAEDLAQGGDGSGLPSLAWREEGRVRVAPDRALVEDLDSLPLPDRTSIPSHLFRFPLTGEPLTMLSLSRGCPHACSFCLAPLYYGRRERRRSAASVVEEVRRQFREIPGIMEGTGRPEYGKVVDIVTRDSLRELVTPGVLAVLSPIAVGFGLGVGPLAGFLAGAIGTGTLMAIFLSNAGGAWDNAKKYVEDCNHGGKGSPGHAAAVIGDTIGDPFKDTAGPAINPLLKVMNLVSLLIVAAVIKLSYGADASDPLRIVIALVATAGIVYAVYISRRREMPDATA